MMTDQKENEEEKKMKEVKNYVVVGGLWFDKVNGNTYHNAHILEAETGKEHYTGFEYGYGSAYYSSARDYIINKLGQPEETFLMHDMGAFRVNKKDLKNNEF